MTIIEIDNSKIPIYFKRDRYLNDQLKIIAINAIDHSTLFELTKYVNINSLGLNKDLIVGRAEINGVKIIDQLINNNVLEKSDSIIVDEDKVYVTKFK